MSRTLDRKIINPISKRLKEARVAAGISQKKLGIAAGIDEFSSSARMNQYETGKHVPDFSTLERIAKILNIPSAYFYTIDNDLAELIVKYGKLNKSERNTLATCLDKILTKKK